MAHMLRSGKGGFTLPSRNVTKSKMMTIKFQLAVKHPLPRAANKRIKPLPASFSLDRTLLPFALGLSSSPGGNWPLCKEKDVRLEVGKELMAKQIMGLGRKMHLTRLQEQLGKLH